MPFMLKQYQERCLKELEAYLRRTHELQNADTAFYEHTHRPYCTVEALPGLPYVCIRVPTGGGKTVMASHSVGITCKQLLRSERCVVVWLAPTTQIVEQTLKALKTKRHPYRQALDEAFDGCVSVMDINGALAIQRCTLDSDTVVIVCTMAAFRVTDPLGRKVYAQNDTLMPCFSGLTEEQREELAKSNDFDGKCPSLANLLRVRRPVLIIDEAHNARTLLSFTTLARFNPACILEFTATPQTEHQPLQEIYASNVLTHVSAAELKAEEMIKLPVRLLTRTQWKEAIQEALTKQAELERLAKEEEVCSGEYIRPIVLLQAERRSQNQETTTFEILKKSLIEDFNIPEEQIGVSTGNVKDLEDVDVLQRDCPLRFIITVDRLREGWDCPFAYILCSVTNLNSKTAVEQILGRVLRLPYAKWKSHEDLNHAYAFATSKEFAQAAKSLTDALVESGFERFEAKTLIKEENKQGRLDLGPLFMQPVSEVISAEPNLSSIPTELREKLNVRKEKEVIELVYSGQPMTDSDEAVIEAAFISNDDKVAVKKLCRKSRGDDVWPAAMGRNFSVPALAIRVNGQLELFEDQFREAPWQLSKCDASLSEDEFSIEEGPIRVADVDVDEQGKIGLRFINQLQRQLTLLDVRGPKNEAELAVWLDRSIRHPDITATEMGLFLQNMIRELIEKRGFAIEQLLANRFRLRDAAEEKIRYLRKYALKNAYDQMLLPEAEYDFEVDPSFTFTYPLNQYPAVRTYKGAIQFRNHYYHQPADMNNEEADCAAFIDSLPEVEYWVRNLERDEYSFWLQTSTDKFYPDFVAKLKDERYLAVEYKGVHLQESSDTQEKIRVGKFWEAKSNGRCIFRLVGRDNFEQELKAAVKS